MAHNSLIRDYAGGGSSCPAPMLRTDLITLRNSSLLDINCEYVVTDFFQNRILPGTTLHFNATSANSLSEVIYVKTSYDNEAWFGIYDIDTNILKELRDGRGNIVRDTTGTAVGAFDWGNASYTNCLVENSSWIVSYGSARPMQNVRVLSSSTLNTSGMIAGGLTNFVIENSSSATFVGASITASGWEVSNSSIANISSYSGNTTNSYFKVSNNSTLNLAGSSSQFTGSAVTILDASFVSHVGVSSGAVSANRVTASQASTITHSPGALALNITNSSITAGSSIAHSTGTINTLSSVILENGSSISVGAAAASGGTLSVSLTRLTNGSAISNQSGSSLVIVAAVFENGSRIDKRSGSTGAATLSLVKFYNDSNVDITNTSSNTFSMTGTTLSERASIAKTGNGALSLSLSRISSLSRVNHSGSGNLTLNNVAMDDLSQVTHSTTTAGFTDLMAEVSMLSRSQVQFTGSRTANNSLLYSSTSGVSGLINFSGTTSGQTVTAARADNGSINVANQVVVQGSIANISASSSGSITITANTVAKSLNGLSASTSGVISINGCTNTGSISNIDVSSGGQYLATGGMVNASAITIYSGGRYTQNGGTSSNIVKTFASTLTSGAFSHSNIGHSTAVNKVLTANNANRFDYMGLAAQLV